MRTRTINRCVLIVRNGNVVLLASLVGKTCYSWLHMTHQKTVVDHTTADQIICPIQRPANITPAQRKRERLPAIFSCVGVTASESH